MQRRSTNTKQTPDGKSQHKPANVHLTGRESGTNWHKLAASPAQTLQHWRVFLETKTTIFFPWSATSYICERKNKKYGEKAYIYTFVQKRHTEPRHYWCSVYTQTRCRGSCDRLFQLHADFILLRWWLSGGQDYFFFNIKRCFVLFTPHSTRLGSTESIWKNLYNRHQI